MAWFKFRKTVFCANNESDWQIAKVALTNAQIQGIKYGSYEDAPECCSCGVRIDPRAFGGKPRPVKCNYFIKVYPQDFQKAKQIIAAAFENI